MARLTPRAAREVIGDAQRTRSTSCSVVGDAIPDVA
jgi:hypothetical protein